MIINKFGKRIAGIILSMTMTLSLASFTVLAVDPEPIDTRTKEGTGISTEEAYARAVDSNNWSNWPQGPMTSGEGNIILDAETGAILYAKNIDGKAYPASITKVVTMLIALENANLDDTVRFSHDSVYSVPYSYAHIGMKEGEEINLKDALYGMMLASANEVAYSIGESVGENLGEDYDWFIQKMNERCKELGGMNTNFTNTNGLDDEEHYTTARDMALITQELLINHPEFETVSQTLQYTIPATNITTETRTFQQNHKMFYSSNQHYDARVIAGKTGYTDTALNTLITCADDGNMKLISVNLKTHGANVYSDTENLLNYGFDNFEQLDVSEMETSKDIGSYVGNSCVTVPKGVTFDELEMSLEENGDKKTATVIYTYNGVLVGKTEVELSESYIAANYPELLNQGEENKDTENKKIISFQKIVLTVLKVIIAIIVILAIIVIFLIIRKKRIMRERRRRRQAAMRRRRMQQQRRNRD